MAAPTCPTDCSSQTLPVVNFNNCAPEINASEIEEIFMGKADDAAFADWSDAAEWATRLSQSATTAGKIRRLSVIGDKPAPNTVKKTVSKQRELVTKRTHTINFDVDETNDDNYDAMRQVQCGGLYLIWYKTRGGYLYGGDSGILMSLDAFDLLARGDEDEKFQYTGTWEDKFDPERIASPI